MDQFAQSSTVTHSRSTELSRIRDSGHHRRHILLVLVLLRRRRRRISSCSSMSSRSSSLSSVGGDLTDANYKSDVIIPLHPVFIQKQPIHHVNLWSCFCVFSSIPNIEGKGYPVKLTNMDGSHSGKP
ncbi:unnamed protein product [Adineta ricciae]|uniref:Uncharacterized protein n=1 Tax=Adineta ricciae TaxID=249248 RepID=A0A814Z867_ADIRI|nr:unnamed protein product [Adineta ricciae]